MRKQLPLQRFDRAARDFIRSRRALGRAVRVDESVLTYLRRHLCSIGAVELTRRGFESWRASLQHCAHNTQVDWAMMIHRFCRYRRRREPRCFLPGRWTIGRHRPYPLPTPIEPEQVRQLLDFIAGKRGSRNRLLAFAAQRLAVILLYTAGLRRGEVARLRLEDVDPEGGLLRIVGSKFHKSRWVPLSVSAAAELRDYLRLRLRLLPSASRVRTLLCNAGWHGYGADSLGIAVRRIMRQSDIWRTTRVPRIHDYRHAFAVAALRRWYEEGLDVQAQLPKLSLYMGHVSIASTAHYLRFMPAVVTLAGERFAGDFASIVERGAP